MERRVWLMGLTVALLAICPFAFASEGRIISAYGVRVTVSAGWRKIEPAAEPRIPDPKTVLVVGTDGVIRKTKPSRCQITAYRIPTRGAVVVIIRWRDAIPPNAGKPGLKPLAKLVAVSRPSFECFSGRGNEAQVSLRDHVYQVNVLVGDTASAALVAEALRVARSFNRTR
jgi:hypothetical protein